MNEVSDSPTKKPEKAPETKPAQRAAAPTPFASLREQMERAFDDVVSGFPLMPFSRRSLDADPWRRLQAGLATEMPSVDVVERDGAYVITAELPGMEEKDVHVSLSGDILTVKGEKKQESEEKRDNYVVSERRFGAFQRSFRVPEDADTDAIAATFKNGVLTLTLPKRPDPARKEKRVQITAG